MLKAVHKETNKLVPAFKLEEDASWIGKEKENWVAPYPEIDNWKFLKENGITEVIVSFIKSYRKEDGTPYRSHFRILTEHAIPCRQNESEEHKLAKEGIYEDVLDNLIKINGQGIRDLFQIEDIDFEFRLSKSKFSKIADVIITFKEKDTQYGKGIIFEIQLSRQNFEQTDDRTYDRITEGYSVVWLWDGMFNENNKLKNREIIIVPFLKAIEEYREKKAAEFYNDINSLGQVIDKKIEEAKMFFEEERKKLSKGYKEQLINITELFSNEFSFGINEAKNNIKLFIENKINELKNDEDLKSNILNSLNYNYLANIIKDKEILNVREELQKKLQEEISKEIKQKISSSIIDDSIKNIVNSIYEKYQEIKINIFVLCEKCKKPIIIPMAIYERGSPYCEECFNNLPTNWKKEHFNFIKIGEKKDGPSKIS